MHSRQSFALYATYAVRTIRETYVRVQSPWLLLSYEIGYLYPQALMNNAKQTPVVPHCRYDPYNAQNGKKSIILHNKMHLPSQLLRSIPRETIIDSAQSFLPPSCLCSRLLWTVHTMRSKRTDRTY